MAIETLTWLNSANTTITGSTIANANTGTDACTANAGSVPDAVAVTFNGLPQEQDWELRCRLADRNPNGRAYIGIARDPALNTPGNFVLWDYCLHVSTENKSGSNPPHPANTVYVYEGSSTPKAWVDGLWTNDGQQIRIQNIGGVVRYWVDCLLIYRSNRVPEYPAEFVVGMACHNMRVIDTEIVTGPGAGIGSGAIVEGPTVGTGCAAVWTIPTPTALPQPPTAGAPRLVRFQEMISEWSEYGHEFADNSSRFNTRFKDKIRMFEIEWDGLSTAEAAVLDAHYDSTSGGLTFSITNPHTAEVITGCRYAAYSRTSHTRYWSQSRSARIIRYAV